MKRALTSFAVAALVALGIPAAASATVRPTLMLAQTQIGKILVTGHGSTVYMFGKGGRDRKPPHIDTDNFQKVMSAARSALRVGAGVNGKLVGTMGAPGASGERQVTYNGHPLYTRVRDPRSDDTRYVGLVEPGGRWEALSAAGNPVK